MATMRWHFTALLSKILPSPERREAARELPGEVRAWLKDHEYETIEPHTRLSGSYARQTAILEIPDVDVLLFRPRTDLDRTPNAVVLELKRVLDDYPNATAGTRAQRRSVHLTFEDPDLHLDIVPVVAGEGEGTVIRVPDRQRQQWIESDPLGYADSLSRLNQEHSRHAVPLIKLIKAWRAMQLPTRRPKSYVLEVMIFQAVDGGHVTLVERGTGRAVADFFNYIEEKYRDLMDHGTGVPRILDPQLGTLLTGGWERSHFETFMRRIREAATQSRKAMNATDDDEAAEAWTKVFGGLWPTEEEVRAAARAEAATVAPGVTKIGATGAVVGPAILRSIPTVRTTFHGAKADPE